MRILKRRFWQASKPEIQICIILNRLITQIYFELSKLSEKKIGKEIICDSEMTILFARPLSFLLVVVLMGAKVFSSFCLYYKSQKANIDKNQDDYLLRRHYAMDINLDSYLKKRLALLFICEKDIRSYWERKHCSWQCGVALQRIKDISVNIFLFCQ